MEAKIRYKSGFNGFCIRQEFFSCLSASFFYVGELFCSRQVPGFLVIVISELTFEELTFAPEAVKETLELQAYCPL